MYALKLANAMLFLSTLSLRRATVSGAYLYGKYFISIHALLAESDQLSGQEQQQITAISIHALLAESDIAEKLPAQLIEQFLSTLSLRRATAMQRS